MIFKSNTTVKDVFDIVYGTTDIPDYAELTDEIKLKNIVMWINEVEQMIYDDFIKNPVTAKYTEFPVQITGNSSGANFDFRDIMRVFEYEHELARGSGNTLVPRSYYVYSDSNGNQFLDTYPKREYATDITVIYNNRPPPKTVSGADTEYIMLPDEWVRLIVCYCKAKQCALFLDAEAENKFISEYNMLIEDFKTWIDTHLNTTF